MTPDPFSFSISPVEDDTERSAGPGPALEPPRAVPPHPAPTTPPAPPAVPLVVHSVPVVAAAPVGPSHPYETVRPDEPARPAPPEREPEHEPAASPVAASEEPDKDETGDEAIHTLLSTAATERPVEEVASLVARLQASGEVSSPADVALRAAAVSRPLDEVRQLVALLSASGYDLHQAETALRAAAVGRPIEDVVELVNILGTDASDWRCAGGPVEERKAGPGQDGRETADGGAVPVVDAASKRRRGSTKPPNSGLDGALAAGPGSHTASSALRSALRWPAAVALLACGLVHVPSDLADLRAGSQPEMLSLAVTVLCLLCGLWFAVRDTMILWAAAAGLAVSVVVLQAAESAGMTDLVNSSPAFTLTWAKATALLTAAAVVAAAGSTLLRHTKTADAADNA